MKPSDGEFRSSIGRREIAHAGRIDDAAAAGAIVERAMRWSCAGLPRSRISSPDHRIVRIAGELAYQRRLADAGLADEGRGLVRQPRAQLLERRLNRFELTQIRGIAKRLEHGEAPSMQRLAAARDRSCSARSARRVPAQRGGAEIAIDHEEVRHGHRRDDDHQLRSGSRRWPRCARAALLRREGGATWQHFDARCSSSPSSRLVAHRSPHTMSSARPRDARVARACGESRISRWRPNVAMTSAAGSAGCDIGDC